LTSPPIAVNSLAASKVRAYYRISLAVNHTAVETEAHDHQPEYSIFLIQESGKDPLLRQEIAVATQTLKIHPFENTFP
jgi:hypothetical protein